MTSQSPATVVISCSVFRPELEALRAAGRVRWPVEYIDSRLHLNPAGLRSSLDIALARHRAAGRRVVLLYGDCHPWMVEQRSRPAVAGVTGGGCPAILLGTERHRALSRSGAFFLLPEWVERWREILGTAVGNDPGTSGPLMRELHSRFVYLDTGVRPIPPRELEEIAARYGLPVEIEPVDLEHLAREIEAAAARASLPDAQPEQALQSMLLTVIEEILAATSGPADIGPTVTDRLRELTGARLVGLVVSDPSRGCEAHRVLSASPGRRAEALTSTAGRRLASALHDADGPALWLAHGTGEEAAHLRSLGFASAIGVPLGVGSLRVGSILLLGLLDLRAVTSVLALLRRLAPLVALAVRNALLFERQDALVAARTVELAQARDAEAAFRAALGALHGVTLALSATHTEQELWRQAIELGRSRLGFDRLAVWLTCDDPAVAVGTFGVDAEGVLRDEREIRLALDPDWDLTRVLRGEETLLALQDTALYENGEVVAHGCAIKAALWDGAGIAGCLCADDYVRRGALPPHMADIARLYAQSLGYLVARVRREEQSRELEAQLQRTQRLESLGVLAGGIAHDFNNILSAMIGFTELAQERAGDAESEGYLRHVLSGATRARDLVTQILAFSRQIPMQRTPVALDELAEDALRFARASLPSTVEIESDLAAGVPPVLADATQVHQVIVNLCTNAEYAMRPAGGTLRVALRAVEVGPGEIEDLAPGRYAVLSVSDTGCGMDAATRDRAFEPFFSTKPVGEGTGLGLATSHGIVSSHGGTMTVASEEGVGSTFRVYLPTTAAVPAAPVGRAPGVARGSGRVLFAEDEPALRSLGATMLQSLGYEVTLAEDGEEALGAIVAEPGAFDVVLTDLTMPRRTGLDAAAAMRAAGLTTPIVVMTGQPGLLSERLRQEIGAVGLLRKPFTRRELSEAMQAATGASAAEPRDRG